MKINQIKIIIVLFFTVTMIAVVVLNSSIIQSSTRDGSDVAATYKAQCAACHTAKAEKFFDPSKTGEALAEIILKGKKGEKPPFMPAFETKGITAGQASELVGYMKGLRAACSTGTNSNAANVNTASNTTANTSSITNANGKVNSNVNTIPDAKAIEEATAIYKTKCMACHTARAEKFFDTAKTDNELVEAILKGKKGAKPPYMPGFTEKGLTDSQAKTLVFYMRQLKTGK